MIIVHAEQTSRIWCADGKIVDAESGCLTGELACHRIWGLDAGELRADFRPVRRARSIQSSTPGLMLEAARRKDECAMLRNQGAPMARPGVAVAYPYFKRLETH